MKSFGTQKLVKLRFNIVYAIIYQCQCDYFTFSNKITRRIKDGIVNKKFESIVELHNNGQYQAKAFGVVESEGSFIVEEIKIDDLLTLDLNGYFNITIPVFENNGSKFTITFSPVTNQMSTYPVLIAVNEQIDEHLKRSIELGQKNMERLFSSLDNFEQSFDHPYIGKYFHESVADGTAIYLIVAKVGTDYLVKNIPYGDEYVAQHIGSEAVLDGDYVEGAIDFKMNMKNSRRVSI